MPADKTGPIGRKPPSSEAKETAAPLEEGLYIISVAARILEMHPQTLRKYERAGLVRPSRTVGMLRLYSEDDIARLRVIKHLVDQVGLNLAGVDLAITMMQRLVSFRQRLTPRRSPALDALHSELQEILDILSTG
jgi:MerR family transcriptional regulator/heat shock protein HspR